MQFKGIRWLAVALAAVLLLGLLLGGRLVYDRVTADQPLFKSLSELKEVKASKIDNNTANSLDIRIELNAVDDLAVSCERMAAAVAPVAGTKPYRLLLTDNRSAALAAAYHQIHFALQEGVATGDFTAMGARVSNYLNEAGLSEHRITVARDFVFVQIHQGDAYLYEIIPRTQAAWVAVLPPEIAGGEQG